MQLAKYIAGRYPVSHHWDRNENKLLVCEAIILNPALSTENGDLDGQAACTLSAENDSVSLLYSIDTCFLWGRFGCIVSHCEILAHFTLCHGCSLQICCVFFMLRQFLLLRIRIVYYDSFKVNIAKQYGTLIE